MRALCLLPILASSALAAADAPKPLATYAGGGPAIAANQAVEAQRADAVTRVDLVGFRDGHVDLRPGTRLTLATEPGDKPGRDRLVVQIDQGAARIDVHGTGPYQELRVRGAAVDVRVTGTLFVVERVQRDADYVSLLRGHLVVSLRQAVAEALKQPRKVDLDSHQGVGASTTGGLGAVAAIGDGPALGVKSDGGTAEDAFAPELTPPVGGDGLVFSDLAEDLGNNVIGELGGAGGISGDVISIGGGFTLAGPPPPP